MVLGMTTFARLLENQLRHNPGRPFITFYDHATGERVELSLTTYANWIAKAASLLVEEHDQEKGATIHLDLPPHWLSTVFLGAAWTAGLVVTDDAAADVIVCGPESVERWGTQSDDRLVLACSLLPMGTRFTTPLPPAVHDVGLEIWSQPDAFTAWDPPTENDPAYVVDGAATTHSHMCEAAAAGSLLTSDGRLLSVANPASPPGFATLVEPLARSGSVIVVAHPDPALLETAYVAERATARFPD